MLATDPAASELTLPAPDVRRLARRLALPALLAVVAAGIVLTGGGPLHSFTEALQRGLTASPAWAVVAIGFETVSLAGYVAALSVVAGRATPRIGARQSAQITLAGAAATRLLPTAGVGGAALAVWVLRRAGLTSRLAARTLLSFMVVLYAVFLIAIAVSGALLAFGLVSSRGPSVLSAIPTAGALAAIAFGLVLARHRRARSGADVDLGGGLRARLVAGAGVVGQAIGDAGGLIRSGDLRLLGAVAYWLFDAAVLWAMLHAFGTPPAWPVVLLAYLVGQVANTIPIPGSVSGGVVGVLLAFGLSAGLALPAVLAYRLVSVWAPLPAAIAVLPALRATVARWAREDSAEVTPSSASV